MAKRISKPNKSMGMSRWQIGVILGMIGLNLCVLLSVGGYILALESEAISPSSIVFLSQEPARALTPSLTPDIIATLTPTITSTPFCQSESIIFMNKLKPHLENLQVKLYQHKQSKNLQERSLLVNDMRQIRNNIDELAAAACVQLLKQKMIRGFDQFLYGLEHESELNGDPSLRARFEEGAADMGNSVEQISSLAKGQGAQTASPTMTPSKYPSATPGLASRSLGDFINYAKNVAIVSPEYGGQYIIKETIQIRSTVEVNPTGYEVSQGITRIVCIGYSFSANQINGRRVDNINRAINIYLQNGSFWHKQLRTESC